MENKMINIPSTVNDPKYRYKMPKMQLKIESKGNGIKTNIFNLTDVAKHLRTSQEYILKFFGYEKATQTMSKEVSKNNKTYIINGQFTYDEMIKILDKFIEKYICCPKCKYPEINMTIVDGRIKGKCFSCPYNGQLDNKHKLKDFILKHPPENNEKREHVIAPKVEMKHDGGNLNADKEEKSKLNQKIFLHNFIDKQLEFGTLEMDELIVSIRKFISDRIKDDTDITSALLASELKPLSLKKALYAFVIFNGCFSVNIAKQVQQTGVLYKNLMKKLVSANVELQTMLNLQYMLLETNKEKNLIKYIPTIMMKLYECDIFSREFLIGWSKGETADIEKNYLFTQERNQQFLKICGEFLQFLNEDDNQDEQEQDE